MIEIDTILVSKCVSPWKEEMICMSGALLIIVGCPRDHGMEYSDEIR